MLFRSASRHRWLRILRASIWPQRGFRRSWIYIGLRILRIKASDYALAMGFACGVFVTFTPFIGFHLVMAGVLAWLLRGNILIALLATLVGNPWTYPFIWAASYAAGIILLERAGLAADLPAQQWHSSRELLDHVLDAPGAVFIALGAGGCALGLVSALIAFCMVFTFANRIRLLMAKLLPQRRRHHHG